MAQENIARYSLDNFDQGAISERIGFFKALLRLHDVAADGIVPCIVRKVNAQAGTVWAEPIVANVVKKSSGNVAVKRPVYEDVPVLSICHGGFSITIPMFVGDTGLLVALDRNCQTAIAKNSSALTKDQSEDNPENNGAFAPDDASLASFDHSVFVPFSFAAPERKDGAIVVKSIQDGGIRMEISSSGISVSGNGAVERKFITDVKIEQEDGNPVLYKKTVDAEIFGNVAAIGNDESDWTKTGES